MGGVTEITQFRGKYFFLSNFYPERVFFEGREFPTSEHAYQASKTESEEWKSRLASSDLTASAAKKLGRKAPLKDSWEFEKIDCMRRILEAKFSAGTECASLLDSTGDAVLVEENWWGDRFWGVSGGRGENWLGRLLMEQREANRRL